MVIRGDTSLGLVIRGDTSFGLMIRGDTSFGLVIRGDTSFDKKGKKLCLASLVGQIINLMNQNLESLC
jgi:hypothetical protein